jgi:hypothetical protein
MRSRSDLLEQRRTRYHHPSTKPFRPTPIRLRMLSIANQIRKQLGKRRMRVTELFQPGAYRE